MSARYISHAKSTTTDIPVSTDWNRFGNGPASYIGVRTEGASPLRGNLDTPWPNKINGLREPQHAPAAHGHEITSRQRPWYPASRCRKRTGKPGWKLVLTDSARGRQVRRRGKCYVRTWVARRRCVGRNALSKKLVATVKRDGFEYPAGVWKGTGGNWRRRGRSRARNRGTFYSSRTKPIFKVSSGSTRTSSKGAVRGHGVPHSGMHSLTRTRSPARRSTRNPGGLSASSPKLVADGQKPSVDRGRVSWLRETGDKTN